MKKYYENERIRKITQSVVTAIQAALAILAVTFMLLFVTTGAGSNSPDYSVTAIVFTVIFCAYYLAQLILPRRRIFTHRKETPSTWRS